MLMDKEDVPYCLLNRHPVRAKTIKVSNIRLLSNKNDLVRQKYDDRLDVITPQRTGKVMTHLMLFSKILN